MKIGMIILFLYAFLGTSILSAEPLTVVTFNLENLFDTEDDIDNPHDDSYLPFSVKIARGDAHSDKCEDLYTGFYQGQCKTLDWSPANYQLKLSRIADVITDMPVLPDILVVPETENKKVLDDLAALDGLSEYKVVHLDSSDEPESRGIDVGLLTTLPVVGMPVAHTVNFHGDTERCGKTRDILEATLLLPNGEELVVYGVHFPSGGNPLRCRIRAMNFLNELAADLPDNSLAVAAGDFNINCNETTSPAFERLLFRGNWYVSPVVTVGCTAPGSSKFVDHVMGTWNTWSFLDLILVSRELSPSQPSSKNWFADLGSFQTLVVNGEQAMVDEDDQGYIEPRRFDPETGRGVSDHWPVGIRLINRR